MSAAARVFERKPQPPAPLERLIDIWSRILNDTGVGPDSNFFDLGGDSLLAVGLFLEIEQEFGRSLPITTIYDAPTVAELAGLIEADAAPEFSPLVSLKEGDGSAPFFIVHGIGGTVIELSALGRNIRIPGPVYALQARGLDGAQAPLETVDQMADLYVDAIRQTQPAGPYRLAGYSFGGLVAVEMARRLRADRQEISLLVLIDAFAHPVTWPLPSRVRMQCRRAFGRFRMALTSPLDSCASVLLRRAKAAAARARRFFSRAKQENSRPLRQWLLDRNPNLPLPLLKVREAGEAALSSYVPQFYPGRIMFLKAAGRDPEFPGDPQNIWRTLVHELEIRTVAGSHRTAVTEHAQSLADRLTECISQSRRPRAIRAIPNMAGVWDAPGRRHLQADAGG